MILNLVWWNSSKIGQEVWFDFFFVSVIELACGEYENEIIDKMVNASKNGSVTYKEASSISDTHLNFKIQNGMSNVCLLYENILDLKLWRNIGRIKSLY